MYHWNLCGRAEGCPPATTACRNVTESRLRQRKGARLFLFNGGEGARFLCATQGVDMQSCGWRHRRTSICVLMNALRLLLQLITCINQCWRCLSLHPCFTQAAEEDPPCSPHSRPLQQQQALPGARPHSRANTNVTAAHGIATRGTAKCEKLEQASKTFRMSARTQ